MTPVPAGRPCWHTCAPTPHFTAALRNAEHPNNRGVVCGKGNAGLMVAYDADRLKFPMRRAGERGENKWQQSTWPSGRSPTTPSCWPCST